MRRTALESRSQFDALVDRHRAELRAHCIRLLGSPDDADDAVQEAMLRAWRGLPRLAERKAARAWLYRIATNASLDEIRRRPDPAHPVDEIELECDRPAPDARSERREELELALIAAHRVLPPFQRAVLILREMLGFSARETARLVGRTETAVHSALQRARAKVASEPPELDREGALRSLPDPRLRAAVRRQLDAWERGDVRALAAILAGEARRAAGDGAAAVASPRPLAA